jgi:hypothetical protein
MNIESLRSEVQAFADQGNYHAAVNVALSGLNACVRQQDQANVDQCLSIIEAVIQQLVYEFGSTDYKKGR